MGCIELKVELSVCCSAHPELSEEVNSNLITLKFRACNQTNTVIAIKRILIYVFDT